MHGPRGHDGGRRRQWTVQHKSADTLRILIEEILHDSAHDLGVDPGLQKDGVEKHLQELLAEHPATLADGLTLVRREYPTAIGPVDLMCRDAARARVAVEIKRRGEIDGVEQLTRYLELLNRDPCSPPAPVRGIFAAQEIKPQARVLADRPRHHLRSSTTTRCAASTTRRTACSERRVPPLRGAAPSPVSAKRRGLLRPPLAAQLRGQGASLRRQDLPAQRLVEGAVEIGRRGTR